MKSRYTFVVDFPRNLHVEEAAGFLMSIQSTVEELAKDRTSLGHPVSVLQVGLKSVEAIEDGQDGA